MSLRSGRVSFVAVAALVAASLAACERTTSGAAASGAGDSSATPAVAPDRSVHASATQDTAPASRVVLDTASPGTVVTAYFSALRARSTARDTMLWEPSTGSDDGFRTFRDTTMTAFNVGVPGRIEGAAGSRYVDVPLTVDLTTRTAPIRLRGTATLRRAVVDGASEAQRRWRIVRIQWGAPTAPSLDTTRPHS